MHTYTLKSPNLNQKQSNIDTETCKLGAHFLNTMIFVKTSDFHSVQHLKFRHIGRRMRKNCDKSESFIKFDTIQLIGLDFYEEKEQAKQSWVA